MIEHTFEEEYSVDVQKKFIGLLVQDKLWAELNGFNIITPELFENRILHNICQWIHTYYKKRKDIPTKLILKEKAKDFTNEGKAKYNDYFLYEQALEDIYLIEGGEAAREEWKEKAVKFVRTIKWKKALENGTSAFDMNNAEQAIEKFKEVLTIGTENDLGIDMSERSIDDFISELGQTYDKSNMIHTGIPSWDAALGGGFVKNNLHIIGGCLVGKTKIKTNKGKISIKELSELDNYNDIKIYSWNGKEKIESEIINAFETKKVNKIIHLKFNNGKTLDCTLDHKFVILNPKSNDKNITYENGIAYKEAQYLTEEDEF